MTKDVEAFYSSLQSSGIPKRYTHNLGGIQFDYNDWISTQCGSPKTEEWRKKMYYATSLKKKPDQRLIATNGKMTILCSKLIKISLRKSQVNICPSNHET